MLFALRCVVACCEVFSSSCVVSLRVVFHQVRGIGACGYYRLPRSEEEEAREVEEERREGEQRARKEKEKKNAALLAAGLPLEEEGVTLTFV